MFQGEEDIEIEYTWSNLAWIFISFVLHSYKRNVLFRGMSVKKTITYLHWVFLYFKLCKIQRFFHL